MECWYCPHPKLAQPRPRPVPRESSRPRYPGASILPKTSDYRAITQIIDQFTDALRQQPGIEVVSRRLPFDLTVEKSLSGDIGAQRATEVPRFTVVLSRKAAS